MAKKIIARREVGLGYLASQFLDSTKSAEDLFDQITENGSVPLEQKLTLGDAQAALQKVLNQKIVPIKVTLNVRSLIEIIERAIYDFERDDNISLATMNRIFLDDFKNGLDSVDFKLENSTLIHGYTAAIAYIDANSVL